MKNKGFTLIELLAVIVILAIIATIATPIILGIINDTREKAFKLSLKNVERAYELYSVQNNILEGTIVDIKDLPLDKKNLTGKVVMNKDGKLELKDITDGIYSATGTIDDIVMIKGTVDDLYKDLLDIKVNTNSSFRSVVITVETIDGIPTSYKYKIEGPDNYTKETNEITDNKYTFNKLKPNKQYKVTVTAKNKSGKTRIKTKDVTTLSVDSIGLTLTPQPQEGKYVNSAKVKITYPSIEDGLINYYKWDEGDLTPVTGNEIEIDAQNGILIAGIKDGEETVLSNQITISNIDNIDPVLSFNQDGLTATLIAIEDHLPETPYSCDGGTTWQKENTCTYTEYGIYTVKVRDKAGNIASEDVAFTKPKGLIGTIYYNPTTGSKCTLEQYNTDLATYKTENSVDTPTKQKSGCMKWYIYAEDNTTYTMILDHNTREDVVYNLEDDNKVCKEVCTALIDDTKNWKTLDVTNPTGATGKARFITADEIATITENTSFKAATSTYDELFYFDSNSRTPTATSKGASKYYWLYDYIDDCESHGCNIEDSSTAGYWTNSPLAFDSEAVWFADWHGRLVYDRARAGYGIRPVIKISKF